MMFLFLLSRPNTAAKSIFLLYFSFILGEVKFLLHYCIWFSCKVTETDTTICTRKLRLHGMDLSLKLVKQL